MLTSSFNNQMEATFITIELHPDTEAGLRKEAEAQGISSEQYVRKLVERRFPPSGPNRTEELFAEWAREDATDDPEEIARRNREWQETKKNLGG